MAKKNRPLGGLFLSTPSARRATHIIHTCTFSYAYFYPRPPRGGRHIHDFVSFCIPAFLSTPSARRATRRSCTGYQGQSISIHALREEGDFSQYSFPLDIHDFYPRPPRGGRPKDPDRVRAPWEISIHALREEGDGQSKARCTAWRNFYPRPPRGGRLLGQNGVILHAEFLSTPSARRATA